MQQLRQGFRIFLVDDMAGVLYDFEFRISDILRQEIRRRPVCPVFLPAKDERGALDVLYPVAEIQVFQGVTQGKCVFFVKRHRLKNGFGQKPENGVLKTKRRFGDFAGRSDQNQRSLVYKGRKVALYGGAYAPSYLPNDVDKSTPK